MADYDKFPNLAPEAQLGKVLPVPSAYIQYYDADANGEPRSGQPIITLQGLNVKFDVRINTGNVYPLAKIGVCNVNARTRDFLTNYMNFANLNYDKRVVRLYAGYLRPGDDWKRTPHLFSGNILYTRFSEPPDIWLELDCIYKNVVSALKPNEWTIKGEADAKKVLETAAKQLKLGLLIRDTPTLAVSNFSASGDGKALMRKLRNTYHGYAIYIDNGSLVCIKHDRPEPAPGETVWEVREDTGMIGIPVVEYQTVECTVLFNPNIRPGDWINLKSKGQPSASGRYRIFGITHTGELRGNDFYTKLEAFYPGQKK